MRKILWQTLFPAAVLFGAVLLLSCSNEMEDGGAENRESIETQTAEIGREAAEAIKVPMENAQDTVDRENERVREYEKRLNE